MKEILTARILDEKEYNAFKKNVVKKEQRFLESKRQYTPTSQKWRIEFTWDKRLDVQSAYTNIPYRDEKKEDLESTVASDGSAILVAKFLEIILCPGKEYTVQELADMAVRNGYKGYKKSENGWISCGTQHVFFDRFLPSLYGYKVLRAASVEAMLEALKEDAFSVLLVSNYKEDSINQDSHFVVMCGYDEEKDTMLLYDPDYPKQIEVNYTTVMKATRNAWMVYD